MFAKDFVIVDLETTGLSPVKHEIIEIGAIRVENNQVVDTMDIFIKPNEPVSRFITNITGITNSMLRDGLSIEEGLAKFWEFSKDSILVAHNAKFDMGFLNNYTYHCFEKKIENKCLDTLSISKQLISDIPNYKLGTLAKYFDVDYEGAHRALKDCEITLDIYNNLNKIYKTKEIQYQ